MESDGHSSSGDALCWYAMSSPYNTQLASQRRLEEMGIETFVPMHVVTKVVRGKRKSVTVPAVSNLLFAKSTRLRLSQAKEKIKRLQFKVSRADGRNLPIVVPDAQMENFMLACRVALERMVFVSSSDVDWEAGTPVRIVSGTFAGLDGILARVKGKRAKKVALSINNFVSAYITEIPAECVERIEKK